jgi:hypothetical protein
MQGKLKYPLLALWTVAVTLAGTTAKAEDIAIVTGIGNYANLPDARLEGIDNDVRSMEQTLHSAGFTIIRLFDAQATEDGIRSAFARAQQRVRPGDRFVYYQSSHGSRDYHILTYDTTTRGDHMLGKEDLRRLMASIDTPRKSLILDACFSGGFLKERGGPFRQVKFYPIGKSEDLPAQGIRDRTDTVRRVLSPTTDPATGRRDFVLFASSQDNQVSRVDEIGGTICSVFTHFLTQQLDNSRHAAWNAVVQPTIASVLRETGNGQNPVFDSAYLPYLVFTTDQRGNGPDGDTVPIRHLGQLYDINNVDADRLGLSANLDGRTPNEGELYHPDTHVKLDLHVGAPGYLFMINRDDQDNAQLVGWDKEDLDTSSPEKMVDGSKLQSADDFEFGKGTLNITTSRREGIEHWKAFLFTDRDDALKFAQMWLTLTTDKNKRVRLNSFANAKLDQITRIGVTGGDNGRALYTSEVHYRVTDK